MLELIGLLESFDMLMALHDTIIARSYCENETLPGTDREGRTDQEAKEGPYRMVGLHKRQGKRFGHGKEMGVWLCNIHIWMEDGGVCEGGIGDDGECQA